MLYHLKISVWPIDNVSQILKLQQDVKNAAQLDVG